MRITGGEYKNKRISIPVSGHTIRPTSDKMRQAIFNMIDHASWGVDLHGKIMVDGFCGSGVMGIEALSRGAEKVIFIDKDKKNIARLRGLLQHDIPVDQTRYALSTMDLTKKLNVLTEKIDLVFLDPPYGQDLITPTLTNLLQHNALNDNALCICEVEKRAELELIADIQLIDERRYGDSKLLILRYNPSIEEAE